jgi:hypothetical protein
LNQYALKLFKGVLDKAKLVKNNSRNGKFMQLNVGKEGPNSYFIFYLFFSSWGEGGGV